MSDLTNPNFNGMRANTHKWSDIAFSHEGHEPYQTGEILDTL